MNKYHKIQSVFKRDKETHRFTDEFSMPEFDYLKNLAWEFTEKLDGMNMRVGYEPGDNFLQVGGRTDKAEISGHLRARMDDIFTVGKMARIADGCSLTIYGEGIGSKIQKGGVKYFPPSNDGIADFILFDVQHGQHWASRAEVLSVAHEVGCRIAPFLGCGTIGEAIAYAKSGFDSWLEGSDREAEGLVIRPTQELRGRWGQRIIAKVKTRDFK